MAEFLPAVILARGGSKGIKNKNLQCVGNKSLIRRTIESASFSSRISEIFVSSDSNAILAEAEKYGAQSIMRPAKLSGDDTTSEEAWLHAVHHIEQNFLSNFEKVVFLQCTSPFINHQDIDLALAEMAKYNYDCILSGTEDHPFLWQQGSDGALAINHNPKMQRYRRQDLPKTLRETGAFYCVMKESFVKSANRFCGTCGIFEVTSFPLDIDKPIDLLIAQAYQDNFNKMR